MMPASGLSLTKIKHFYYVRTPDVFGSDPGLDMIFAPETPSLSSTQSFFTFLLAPHDVSASPSTTTMSTSNRPYHC